MEIFNILWYRQRGSATSSDFGGILTSHQVKFKAFEIINWQEVLQLFMISDSDLSFCKLKQVQ